MEFETLKKDNRHKWLIGISVVLLLVVGYMFVGSRAKYRNAQSIDLVDGVINWTPSDLEMVSIKVQSGSDYVEANTVPTSGYILNTTKSYCGLSNGDGTYTHEAVTMNYHDGVMAFDNMSKKGTKCFLYFDEENFLMAESSSMSGSKPFLKSNVTRDKFESVTTLDNKTIPDSAISSWDVSKDQNGSVMAWYTDTDNNGLYELYIGQNGGVAVITYLVA